LDKCRQEIGVVYQLLLGGERSVGRIDAPRAVAENERVRGRDGYPGTPPLLRENPILVITKVYTGVPMIAYICDVQHALHRSDVGVPEIVNAHIIEISRHEIASIYI